MIGAALGAITSLVGIGLQAQAQAAQMNLQYAQFNWQKQRAREQDRFAQAGRQDAYGNETYFDSGLNKWMTKLTPMQKEISQAGEKEQRLQLTQDAPAARKIRAAVQKRSEEAKEPYNRAMNAYQYAQPPSELSIRNDLTQLMATNNMARSKADQALLMRQAARLGTGAKAEEIIGAVDQKLGAGQKDALLAARNQAVQERAARVASHETEFGPQLKMWADLMQQGGNLPDMPKSSLNQDLGSAISSQNAAMQRAFASGTEGVSGAFSGLAGAAGKSPSFEGLAQILAGIDKGKKSKYGSEDDQRLNTMGSSSYSQNVPGYGYSENIF
jgi:hypothetical protein